MAGAPVFATWRNHCALCFHQRRKHGSEQLSVVLGRSVEESLKIWFGLLCLWCKLLALLENHGQTLLMFRVFLLGKYSATSGSSGCTSCFGGTYSSSTGASSASTCETCPSGTYSGSAASACACCYAGGHLIIQKHGFIFYHCYFSVFVKLI